jgi:colanic acid biosynthesis glycosyl transferase WcaI
LFNKKAKLIYHVQDLQIDAAIELGIIKNKLTKKILLASEKFILTNANYVSTISIGMREKLLSKYD